MAPLGEQRVVSEFTKHPAALTVVEDPLRVALGSGLGGHAASPSWPPGGHWEAAGERSSVLGPGEPGESVIALPPPRPPPCRGPIQGLWPLRQLVPSSVAWSYGCRISG